MSKKLKVALIGGGQVAEKVHVAYYASRPELELVAVVDSQTERAKEFAERNGIARYYTDSEAMYQAEKPDLVSVCTPNKMHCEHVLQALHHGCHVMCEKPPAMTPDQAYQMWQASTQTQKVLAYDFHHRFADDARLLRGSVASGELGEVYVTNAKALRRCGVPGWGVFTDKTQQGGGPLIDIGIHMLDAAMFVLGFPQVYKVDAHMYQKIGTVKNNGQFGQWDPSRFTVEDALFATLEFTSGSILRLETSFALNIQPQSVMNVEFCGDRAGATLFPAHIYTDDGGQLLTLYQREKADDLRHHKSMEAFVERVLGNPANIADGEQGYIIQKLVDAIYQAAEQRKSIYL
ncbi:Gfo/Idh/MocA family protein [Limnobaculum parvum]|uniref:Gfo/Idh/MocA family oxidoreductase n=1 Tax=Limnobaculum parvum TaxID=2172103 RepID=A0A2Y9TZ52_9GAMM|nr:Gfo/Idh/MocA family oxidoreductase [Limnobaculum parvum]AWH88997.1 gfo/Idh/MocA family oxidoreductase [Limnobaculum parvum]